MIKLGIVRKLYANELLEMIDCPNEGSNRNKRPKSFGSSMNDNITAICYKCQEAGQVSALFLIQHI